MINSMNLQPSAERTLIDLGLLQKDKTFSPRFSAQEISGFLTGSLLTAINGKERLELQMDPKEGTLRVKELSTNLSLNDLYLKSKQEPLQMVREYEKDYGAERSPVELLRYPRKAMIREEKTNELIEFDLLKDRRELSSRIQKSGDSTIQKKYRAELVRLRKFLLESLKAYPAQAAEIKNSISELGKELEQWDKNLKEVGKVKAEIAPRSLPSMEFSKEKGEPREETQEKLVAKDREDQASIVPRIERESELNREAQEKRNVGRRR